MKTVIFIVGAGHSGSTLISKTLNANSKIFALSEIANFEHDINSGIALCGCMSMLSECSFWGVINTHLKNKLGYGIKEQPEAFNLLKKRRTFFQKLKFYLERNMAIIFNVRSTHYSYHLNNIKHLYEAIFEETSAEVIVDSSKSSKRAYLIKKFLKNSYNVKIVHLVRDGRAVLYSYLKGFYSINIENEETGEIEKKTYYSDKNRSEDETIKIWLKDNKLALRYHNSLLFGRNSYFFLRYEDFANQPVKQLKELLYFIGVEYEADMLNLNRYENHMVSGNASRINAKSIQKPFDSWKKKLTQEQMSNFDKKGKKLNQKFGYQKQDYAITKNNRLNSFF